MASNGNSRVTQPEPEEFEVSVFGPGFGECVVLHLGNGEWGIIDSCLDPNAKRPAALHYLESLRVDVSKYVKFVVATHWHDDHIDGLSLVFRAAESAEFVCSAAIREPDFAGVLASWTGTRSGLGGSGIDELHDILSELRRRKSDTKFAVPILALENKTLWKRTLHPTVSIEALAPSDASLIAAMAELKNFTPIQKKPRRRIPIIKPNNSSVVLAVQIGEHRVLLGADLEVQADSALGWRAIVNKLTSSYLKHQGFKIPHHGSHNGHHDDVWNQMLVDRPWAITTPFVKGSVKLPLVEDCHRILHYTKNAYLTAPPRPTKFRDANKAVERTVNETTLTAHFIPGKYGQVRMRKKITASVGSPWGVELFGNAMTIEDYVQEVSS